jgi:hypothetical protein
MLMVVVAAYNGAAHNRKAKERGKDLRKRDFNAEERRGTRRKVEKGATKERTNRER